MLTEKILWQYDEKLGKPRMLSVKEAKDLKRKSVEEARSSKEMKFSFPLDD